MGCFLACFGSSKDAKRRKQKRNVLTRDQGSTSTKAEQPDVSLAQDYSKAVVSPSPEVQDKPEERPSSSPKKKVTFNNNVKTYEPPILPDEDADFPPENCEEGGKKDEPSVRSPQSKSSSEDSAVTLTGSFPPNHRYQNCRDSDDEDEELDYSRNDLSDEDDGVNDDSEIGEGYNEEFDDGLQEDGIICSRARLASSRVVTEEVEIEVKSTGSNLNARDRSVYVDPLLNPVENLTQWKAVKAKRIPISRPEKENCNLNQKFQTPFGKELSFKELPLSSKSESEQSKLNQEISVDASLSNWLSSTETTPVNKAAGPVAAASYLSTPEWSNSQSPNSGKSLEDRPILGALTVEELRQFSASCSPRKSPSRSPDETPIIGTVGTYWNHTDSTNDSGSASSFKGIPNTTSKYREDKKVNWRSTPFKTRLERALNRSAAEDASTDVTHIF